MSAVRSGSGVVWNLRPTVSASAVWSGSAAVLLGRVNVWGVSVVGCEIIVEWTSVTVLAGNFAVSVKVIVVIVKV